MNKCVECNKEGDDLKSMIAFLRGQDGFVCRECEIKEWEETVTLAKAEGRGE